MAGLIYGIIGGLIGVLWNLLRPIADVWGRIIGLRIENRTDAKYNAMLAAMERSSKARALLAELRVKLNADRVSLFEFHNGGVFSNSNPIWRVALTTEASGPGVQPADMARQPIIAGMLIDILNPLLAGRAKDRPIRPYKVNEMEPSFARSTLEANGVATTINVTVYDTAERAIGFIAIDYCDFGHETPAAITCNTDGVRFICEYAAQLELVLSPVVEAK